MRRHTPLAKAGLTGNPAIHGNTVTYIWRGKTAPNLVDDSHNWEENPQTMQQSRKGLWTYSMTLTPDAYIEYAFIDPETGERVPDPLNPNRIWNGIGAYNHFFYMLGSSPTPLRQIARGTPRGKVTLHRVPTDEFILGEHRTVYLYQPPVHEPVPLVVVYDGSDYFKRANLNLIVDNLIASQRVRPFAMAMIQNGGKARSLEYACSDSTLGFILEALLPFTREQLNLVSPMEEPYAVLGASLGGLMALYTALRLPKIFGKVLSQSGAFILPEHEFVVVDLVRHSPPPHLDIWMDAGRFEWLLAGNRQMVALLKKRKYPLTYHEFSGGHNYTSWGNDVWRGLETLFS
jgi:enterochelin esterase family protein